MTYNVKKGYLRNKASVWLGRHIFGPGILKKCNATIEHYTPKHDAFIIIANHTHTMDPGFEILSLKRYIRFVSADFLMRNKWGKFAFKTLGGSIIKHSDKPSQHLIAEIKENIKAGIPVGLHAEGRVTANGETGYVSVNTGKLVKESGAALITYRITGGYLKKPRWAKNEREGKINGHVVYEYSPEYLAELSPEEITKIIKRDIYVNAYEEEKKNPQNHSGEALAEFAERTLFMCPHCGVIGKLHSIENVLACDCGYSVTYGEDGFWHDMGKGLVFDNILQWDKWQKATLKDQIQYNDGLIMHDENQIVYEINGDKKECICNNAKLSLYKDRFEIEMSNQTITIPVENVKKINFASKQALTLVDNENYYFIDSQSPRSAEKYVVAWHTIMGKEWF